MRPLTTLLMTLAVALPACDPLLGIEDLPRATTCTTCSTRDCSTHLATCQGEPSCNLLLACVDACADGACRDACQTRLGTSEAFAELDACRRRTCTAECFGPSKIGGPCQCLDDACRAEAIACAGEPDCDRFVACGYGGGNPNPDRIDLCATRWSSAKAPAQFTPLYRCWQAHGCAGCEVGTSHADACKGNYRWGAETGEKLEVKLFVGNLINRNPLPAITVRACDPFDAFCTTIVTESATNTEGIVELALARQYEGYLKASAPGFAPGLLQFGRPAVYQELLPYGAFFLYPTESLDGAFATAKLTKLDDHGHALVVVHDCALDPFVGVRLETPTSDGSTRTFYLAGPTIDLARTETTSDGMAFVANLPVGQQIVRAFRGDQLVGEHPLEVRAGTVSWLDLYPSPAR
ncbi:MAG: hypothetical protein JNL79_04940 [Myxococcales bacterium]|nr:hypothetical protein [Myxococcales bacterium]